MEIAKILVGATSGTARNRLRIPARAAGLTVSVVFTDPVWDNLTKTVVFRGVGSRIAVFDGKTAVIPWEVLAEPGTRIYFGIYGANSETGVQLPLIEVDIGVTELSADPQADSGTDPTLPIWAQLQADVEQLKQSGGGGSGTPGKPGADGGYYTPAVSQPEKNKVQFAFTPSKADMPAVEPVQVDLPVGQGSGGNAALTTAQIEALHGMFKVCAFTKDDVSAEYAAFKTAFGIKDSGEEEPDEPHTHSYTSTVTTAATCTTAGVRTYTCSCGESYTESIPATGHNYVDGVCTVCGAADPDYSPESGDGDTEDNPMVIESWDYEWAAADGVSLENSGWEQFTAYTGFQSTFDAATGQKLAIVEPANSSVFGGFTLTNYPTATEAVCEAVVNFDTVEQGEFMMSLTDGTNLAGFRILRNQHEISGGKNLEYIFEAGVDYLLRVEFYTDRFRLYVNGGLEYESTAFWTRSGVYHKWGYSGKTMLCVAPVTDSEITTATNAANIKSYKYKVVTT